MESGESMVSAEEAREREEAWEWWCGLSGQERSRVLFVYGAPAGATAISDNRLLYAYSGEVLAKRVRSTP